jgi:hypothetical protein
MGEPYHSLFGHFRRGAGAVSMRWGLVPAWWKKSLKEIPATFDARAESVADKPMFRGAFKLGPKVLKPAPAEALREWKVSPRLNRTGVGDDDPSIVEPLPPA